MADPLTPAEFAALLTKTAQAGRVKDVIAAALVATGLKGEALAKLSVTTGGKSGLNRRSGDLANSIASRVEDGPQGPELSLSAGGRHGGNDVVYARIHEVGGTIRPKRAKFLTIPTQEAKTRAGVARVPSARDMDLSWAQGKSGQPMLIDSSGVAMFILKREVKIPARPFLGPAFTEAAEGFRGRIGTQMLQLFGQEG